MLRNSHAKKHGLFKWNLLHKEACYVFSWTAYVIVSCCCVCEKGSFSLIYTDCHDSLKSLVSQQSCHFSFKFPVFLICVCVCVCLDQFCSRWIGLQLAGNSSRGVFRETGAVGRIQYSTPVLTCAAVCTPEQHLTSWPRAQVLLSCSRTCWTQTNTLTCCIHYFSITIKVCHSCTRFYNWLLASDVLCRCSLLFEYNLHACVCWMKTLLM